MVFSFHCLPLAYTCIHICMHVYMHIHAHIHIRALLNSSYIYTFNDTKTHSLGNTSGLACFSFLAVVVATSKAPAKYLFIVVAVVEPSLKKQKKKPLKISKLRHKTNIRPSFSCSLVVCARVRSLLLSCMLLQQNRMKEGKRGEQ